ncbi:MAG: amidase domain-containing protein [Candidatus Xenobia bacterium]
MYNTLNPMAALTGNPLSPFGAMSPALSTPTALSAPNDAIASLSGMEDMLALESLAAGSGGNDTTTEVQSLIQQIQQLQQELVSEMQSGQDPTATEGELNQDMQQLQQLLGGAGGGYSAPSAPIAGGGGSAGGGSGSGGGGSVGGSSGSGGGGSLTGGSSGGGSGGPVGQTPSTATGNPSQAVQIANQYLGQGSGSFTFANYTHAGGTGNDCADFVSACVADAGTFKKQAGDANVSTFQNDLRSQGWTATSAPQPGDVAIVNGSQHAELVSGPNGQCIGSNGGAVNQTVSHDTPSQWGSVVYWQPPTKH